LPVLFPPEKDKIFVEKRIGRRCSLSVNDVLSTQPLDPGHRVSSQIPWSVPVSIELIA